MKKTRTWKKLTALIIAALMILSVLPAALALPDDWTSVAINLNWTDADGNLQGPVQAYPLAEEPGSFFAYLPPEQNITLTAVTLSVAYREQELDFRTRTDRYASEFNPANTVLDLTWMDAGDVLDSSYSPYIEIEATMPDWSTEVPRAGRRDLPIPLIT